MASVRTGKKESAVAVVTLSLSSNCNASLEALENLAGFPMWAAIFAMASTTCSLVASVVVALNRTRFPACKDRIVGTHHTLPVARVQNKLNPRSHL